MNRSVVIELLENGVSFKVTHHSLIGRCQLNQCLNEYYQRAADFSCCNESNTTLAEYKRKQKALNFSRGVVLDIMLTEAITNHQKQAVSSNFDFKELRYLTYLQVSALIGDFVSNATVRRRLQNYGLTVFYKHSSALVNQLVISSLAAERLNDAIVALKKLMIATPIETISTRHVQQFLEKKDKVWKHRALHDAVGMAKLHLLTQKGNLDVCNQSSNNKAERQNNRPVQDNIFI